MYGKRATGWLKHLDFILLDLVCLQAAFVLAYLSRYGRLNLYGKSMYRGMAVFLLLADIAVIFFFDPFDGVLHRGSFKELAVSAKHGVKVVLVAALYLFTIQESVGYSRAVFYLTGAFYVLITWLTRLFWKGQLQHVLEVGRRNHRMVVITDAFQAPSVLAEIQEKSGQQFEILGVIILDMEMTGERIGDVPVVASMETAVSYVCKNQVDEVFLLLSQWHPLPQQLMDNLITAGITIHLNLAHITETNGKKQMVERIGNYTVLTTSLNFITFGQMFGKRLLDIVGGLTGCLLTGLLYLVVAPVIKIQSPGPVFFTQTRVGKNGRPFQMYKFRTMYPDAEERKKEMMSQNKVQDGMMFKMDFDPRVIGNRILPDGTRKTGFMAFCRRHSIDEFPQFFNVLKGDMSLVGVRPPTLEEVEKYSAHHYARLAARPGVTGLWQVSGRSDIINFEEVVRLDTQYITQWSMGLDIWILLKTVRVVLLGEGGM